MGGGGVGESVSRGLKGRHIIAWGNAPGLAEEPNRALKGHNKALTKEAVEHLQRSVYLLRVNLGRCPWLDPVQKGPTSLIVLVLVLRPRPRPFLSVVFSRTTARSDN